MCVLLIGWRLRSDVALVVAANRDEAYARHAVPPHIIAGPNGRILLPEDQLAGGTWEGVNDSGLVAVITNRRDGDVDMARPSRGGICRGALDRSRATDVAAWLAAATRAQRYNSFNLLHADREHAFVSSWNGALSTRKLAPGVHVLSNDHDLGELHLAELEGVEWSAPLPSLRASLLAVLASHPPRDAAGFRVCKHGGTHGTVSATSILLPHVGTAELEYAPGPPCTTPFAVYELPLTSATAPPWSASRQS